MKSALLFLAVITFVLCVPHGKIPVKFRWEQFKVQYSKSYPNVHVEAERFAIFKDNLYTVEQMNKVGSADYGVTKFMDLTSAEFKSKYLGFQKTPHPEAKLSRPQPAATIPSSWDWNQHGACSPVYNQGECGSCWAFSATEEIESMWFMANQNATVPSLSMQQIVSCDQKDDGCGGGDTPTAYEYVMKAGGLDTFKSYPYTGSNTQCKFKSADIVADISGWAYVTQNRNETAMLYSLAANGPLSICVDAATWQFYGGGIISNFCGHSLDHCVQLTGYNTSASGQDYWIVRNSWGTDWGLNGYLYVERNKDLCGIADEVTIVTPKAPAKKRQ